MAAIIIPAYNEGAIISRALQSLLMQVDDEDEIIVIANGCVDDTALKARAFAPRVTVIETHIPSKINALNMGDAAAKTYPRIYFDADVEFADGSVQAIKRRLAQGDLLAVSPQPLMDFSRSSWFVKAYYKIWHAMPFCRSGLIGGCVYALSEAGRKRFEQFPDVIADDGFARALFKEHERGVAPGAVSKLVAPASCRFLMKIKVRSRMGQIQLARLFPELVANEDKQRGSSINNALSDIRQWPEVTVYLYVTIVSRIKAYYRLKFEKQFKWDRDTSTRA
jgi:hypothetical protein